jgi:plasmid stabilization system protein ParE
VTRIAWHPLARRELFESSDFYEREVAGLGEIFLDKIEGALQRIREHPRSGPAVLHKARKRRVGRFPYNLIYWIEADHIFVLAVAHHKKRPYYWARRR